MEPSRSDSHLGTPLCNTAKRLRFNQQKRGTAMAVKIDGIERNIFPEIEHLDARDAGRNAEVIFGVKIEAD